MLDQLPLDIIPLIVSKLEKEEIAKLYDIYENHHDIKDAIMYTYYKTFKFHEYEIEKLLIGSYRKYITQLEFRITVIRKIKKYPNLKWLAFDMNGVDTFNLNELQSGLKSLSIGYYTSKLITGHHSGITKFCLKNIGIFNKAIEFNFDSFPNLEELYIQILPRNRCQIFLTGSVPKKLKWIRCNEDIEIINTHMGYSDIIVIKDTWSTNNRLFNKN